MRVSVARYLKTPNSDHVWLRSPLGERMMNPKKTKEKASKSIAYYVAKVGRRRDEIKLESHNTKASFLSEALKVSQK